MNNETKKQNTKEKAKNKPIRTVVIIVSVIILVTAGVFFGYWLSSDNPLFRVEDPEIPTGGRGTVALPDNIDSVRDNSDTIPSDANYYAVKMTNDWVFDTTDSPSRNVYVENSTLNNHTVYFDLVLPGTDELIYSSPYMPVGTFIDSITLETALSPGEYEPIVVYHLVDDDGNVLSTLSVKVTLRILG